MKGIKLDIKTGKIILRKMRLSGRTSLAVYRDDWPAPSIEHPTQVKVKTRLGGICHTDLSMASADISIFASILGGPERPMPMGHEVVGEVVEIGSGVSSLSAGDRVAYFPAATCEAYGFALCKSCRSGNLESCYAMAGVGDGSDREAAFGGRGKFGGAGGGGFAEYLVGFEKQFFKVPQKVPDEAAVLTEPFSVGIHAAARHKPGKGQTALVIGGGIIGLMVVTALRALGSRCRIIALVRYPFQEQAARRLGVDETHMGRGGERLYGEIADMTGGTLFKPIIGKRAVFGNEGPDVIFDCVGTEESIDDALHLVRSNGKIVIVGMSYTKTKKVDWSIQTYKEIEIVGSMMYGIEPHNGKMVHVFELALAHLKKNPALFKGLVTHCYRVDEYRKAFDTLFHKGASKAIKVAFDYR